MLCPIPGLCFMLCPIHEVSYCVPYLYVLYLGPHVVSYTWSIMLCPTAGVIYCALYPGYHAGIMLCSIPRVSPMEFSSTWGILLGPIPGASCCV
jgi:hypothetical protein